MTRTHSPAYSPVHFSAPPPAQATGAARLLAGFAIAASLLLGGCAALDIKTPPHPASITISQLDQLGNYAAGLRGRSAAELADDGEALSRAYAQLRSEDNRLRLAVFLALAPTPAGDRNRALGLLDVPPGEVWGRGRNHPLAILLLPLLQEQRRMEESLNTTQTRLREEQKRSEGLQQKLDAIRDIEKKMLERSPPDKTR
ncbi:MAG: hypothetical protein REI94_19945 [Moraxellaceae bacterium]|nr:hypothetical protein [Moraxellaceae bacterium]